MWINASATVWAVSKDSLFLCLLLEPDLLKDLSMLISHHITYMKNLHYRDLYFVVFYMNVCILPSTNYISLYFYF